MPAKPAPRAPRSPLAPRTPLGATPVTLTLPGAPRTKKTSQRIWRVGKRKVVIPSDAWMAWRDSVRAHAITGRWPKYGLSVPLNCCAHFYRDAKRGDAVGYYQGLADVLEEIGVVADDRWITQWDGSRLFVDRENPRVQLVLTPIGEAA
jgi:hypothetical protein